LKKLIKAIRAKLLDDLEPVEKENVLNLNNIESIISPVTENLLKTPYKSSLNEKLYEEFVDSFVALLDKEIKKTYILFIDIEKKLYVKINSHLHIRDSYK